jgi:pectate lyase
VSASNRFIVFDVGGYIQLKTAVSAKSNLTIAGQTAPGGGIGFRGGELSFAKQSNVIVRYVRIRPGSETASSTDDALSLYLAHNVILDHSSFEFAPWNNIDGVSDDWQNYPVTDITFQDSLIADPTGQQFGSHCESVSSQWSWYRNIFANSHNRNPLAKVNTVFVNNLLYNYSAGYTTHTSTNFKHDIVNNYFVFGPASTGTDNTWFQVDKNQSIYYAGNLKDTNLNGSLDGSTTTPYWYQGEGTVLSSAWSKETTAATPLTAASAARVTMSLAGPLPRDPMDALIISQVMTLGKGTVGTGANTTGPSGALYTSQAQTGLADDGYGTIASGTRPTDTDNDGMPDAWERANGTNPTSNDAMTKAADGYAFIEQYVNWLAGPHAMTTTDKAVDVDLSAYATGFSTVSPTYVVASARNGAVALQSDKHTARFTPTTKCHGLSSFDFTVTGSDGTSYTNRVVVLVVP